MTKEFIPYQQALELKELGFDEPCLQFYNHHGTAEPNPKWDGKLRSNRGKWESFIDYDDCIGAPLYQQCWRWFRKKHKLESIVVPSGNSEGKTNGYYFEIIFDFSKDNIESDSYPSYEEAEQACLDKLIEICKNK